MPPPLSPSIMIGVLWKTPWNTTAQTPRLIPSKLHEEIIQPLTFAAMAGLNWKDTIIGSFDHYYRPTQSGLRGLNGQGAGRN